MRVLLVNTYYTPEIMGGAEYSVKKLAEGLSAAGIQVKVLCTGDVYTEETIDGIDVVRIVPNNLCRIYHAPEKSKVVLHLREYQDIWNKRNESKIKAVMEEFKPDVVHSNGLYDLTPIVWKVAREKDARVVHTLRDYFLCCPRVNYGCEGEFKNCLFRFPLCVMHRHANKKHTAYVDCVTAPSEITLNTLLDQGFFSESDHRVVPNATDINAEEINDILTLRQESYDPDRPVRFVYLGTLTEQKGVKLLIEAFEQLDGNNARLAIAGKGALLDYVKSKAETVKGLSYEGFLDEEGVHNLLMNQDVLVAPSLWEEPFGRVVLDAYKHAMPVVVSSHGALPTLVEDGLSGLIAKDDSSIALSRCFEYYIKTPSDVLKHAYKGIQILGEYSIEKQVSAFIDIYKL